MLTVISVILIVIMGVFIGWTFLTREQVAEEGIKVIDIVAEGSTTHLEPNYGTTVDCLEEALAQGAPAEHIKYTCTINFWAEPYIRGAAIQNYVQEDKIGARYHHRCDCKFYVL